MGFESSLATPILGNPSYAADVSSTAVVGGRGFRVDARQTSGKAHLEDAKDRRQSPGWITIELIGVVNGNCSVSFLSQTLRQRV